MLEPKRHSVRFEVADFQRSLTDYEHRIPLSKERVSGAPGCLSVPCDVGQMAPS